MEASHDFGWSEKELRNKMAIWRGYKDIKDAAGWAALVFAGMGIYRFCKYRISFDNNATRRLQRLRKRFELAADTLHPNWRQLLAIVGESTELQYLGHPHDWVVFEDETPPVLLRETYPSSDPWFAFENVDESIVDDTAWVCEDPRRTVGTNHAGCEMAEYVCDACGQRQSDDTAFNLCCCFSDYFGCVKRKPPSVQVFHTFNGRNNGLMALTPFEPGTVIGEFVGLITKGIADIDVMDRSTPPAAYQIWQGRVGNYTRFVNHSCKPNAEFVSFTWKNTERTLLISRGVRSDAEVLVDYGKEYWEGLDKICLCGESCCRYKGDS